MSRHEIASRRIARKSASAACPAAAPPAAIGTTGVVSPRPQALIKAAPNTRWLNADATVTLVNRREAPA
jgi:hypothetical protein